MLPKMLVDLLLSDYINIKYPFSASDAATKDDDLLGSSASSSSSSSSSSAGSSSYGSLLTALTGILNKKTDCQDAYPTL
jgi:hypothetical protein